MESDKANGERFFGKNQTLTMQEMARIVKENCGEQVKTGTMPNGLVKLMAKFIPDFEAFIPLMMDIKADNSKACKLLGWQPRLAKDTVIDTANYLFENHLI